MNETYFAIQHKQTGYLMPEKGGKRARGGYTYDEPTPLYPPRLFNTPQAAQMALTWWLKGAAYTHIEYDAFEGDTSYVRSVYMPGRNADEMRIVPVELRVPGVAMISLMGA